MPRAPRSTSSRASTRTWTVLPVSPNFILHAWYNDYVIVQDGNQVHAFSSHRATVSTITVSSSAVVHTGPNFSSWVAVLPDEVRAFSAYTNSWSSQSFPGAATPSVTVQSGDVLLTSGTDALFCSGFTGAFTPVTGQGPFRVTTDRNVAALTDSSSLTGYSALTGTTASMPFVPTDIVTGRSRSRPTARPPSRRGRPAPAPTVRPSGRGRPPPR